MGTRADRAWQDIVAMISQREYNEHLAAFRRGSDRTMASFVLPMCLVEQNHHRQIEHAFDLGDGQAVLPAFPAIAQVPIEAIKFHDHHFSGRYAFAYTIVKEFPRHPPHARPEARRYRRRFLDSTSPSSPPRGVPPGQARSMRERSPVTSAPGARVRQRRRSILPPSPHQKKWWALTLIRQFGASRDLGFVRPPFLDMLKREPMPEKRVEIMSHRAVLFDHTLGEPVRAARTLDQITINRPRLAAVSLHRPTWIRRRGVDRVLHRKHQVTTGNQRIPHRGEQSVQVLDVMQRQRTVGEAKRPGRQIEPFQIRASVADRGVRRLRPRTLQHFFRYVEAEDVGGPKLARPTAEPAETATEIDNAKTARIRQHGAQRRPLGRAVQTVDGAAQLTVAGEEGGVVVDVLGHRRGLGHPGKVSARWLPGPEESRFHGDGLVRMPAYTDEESPRH